MTYRKEPFFLWFAPYKDSCLFISPQKWVQTEREGLFYSPPAPLSITLGTAEGFFMFFS